jgi:hypothetical protein
VNIFSGGRLDDGAIVPSRESPLAQRPLIRLSY